MGHWMKFSTNGRAAMIFVSSHANKRTLAKPKFEYGTLKWTLIATAIIDLCFLGLLINGTSY